MTTRALDILTLDELGYLTQMALAELLLTDPNLPTLQSQNQQSRLITQLQNSRDAYKQLYQCILTDSQQTTWIEILNTKYALRGGDIIFLKGEAAFYAEAHLSHILTIYNSDLYGK